MARNPLDEHIDLVGTIPIALVARAIVGYHNR